MSVAVDVNEMSWIIPTMDAIEAEIRAMREAMVEVMQRMLHHGDMYSRDITNEWKSTNALINNTAAEALLQFTETNRVIVDALDNKLAKFMVAGGIVVFLLFGYMTALLIALAGFGCWYMYLQQQSITLQRLKLERKGIHLTSEDDTRTRSGYQRIPENESATA